MNDKKGIVIENGTPESQITIDQSPSIDKYLFMKEVKQMNLEAGLIGKLFGASNNAPINITGILAVILIMAGVVSIYLPGSISSVEFWKIIIPLLSMILGYLFGKKT